MYAFTVIRSENSDENVSHFSAPVQISAHYDTNTKTYSMPSIEKEYGKSGSLYWDGEHWIIDTLYPALCEFSKSEDLEALKRSLKEDGTEGELDLFSKEELIELAGMIEEAVALGFFDESFIRSSENEYVKEILIPIISNN